MWFDLSFSNDHPSIYLWPICYHLFTLSSLLLLLISKIMLLYGLLIFRGEFWSCPKIFMTITMADCLTGWLSSINTKTMSHLLVLGLLEKLFGKTFSGKSERNIFCQPKHTDWPSTMTFSMTFFSGIIFWQYCHCNVIYHPFRLINAIIELGWEPLLFLRNPVYLLFYFELRLNARTRKLGTYKIQNQG